MQSECEDSLAPRSSSVSTEDTSHSSSYRLAEELLDKAGLRLDGSAPWDMKLKRPGVPERALSEGSLGLGEAYMDGDWDADQLDEFFSRLMRSGLADGVNPMAMLFHAARVKLLNLQNRKRAWQVGEQHYDLGSDFYANMLDPRMTYTCGYWREATDLVEAQNAKLDLVCRKLRLEPGMRVLDIGCGWGSFMSYAAQNYGVECVGVTISRDQAEWARQRYAGLPLEFRLQDYRDVDEQFDHIVSIGMFEHVGRKNHRVYMETAERCLKDEGLFLLHTIGKNRRNSSTDRWIDKYIFPNGDLPSIGQIGDAVDGLFVVEDLHNFGADYDKTLMAWCENFEAAWPRFAGEMGERFYRMWRYYLLSCAGAFRARDIQLWQWVLSKKGVIGGYERVS
ncbi:cyclopropane fatty acyl phospholipid synthase [Pseudomonas gingeri]|uniref:Cyclopropane fatty acyl phospholipid synthase n=1 Tax=Pseudomonas gingeri TaxID=117681 RepID=A0A7Y7YIA0_9PSED|nr:cyclopropane fatty acyl phospholipid synthase [Pseudomonas gingeri]NWA14507.1 cyclopropane fatty acyl phospholipid synthase [Pseudomonas gingeri]NWA54875.1 cyclopropane fatty acyl phospholipid synthase [Pseudomonas gingeri]NWA94599.1 cyclopropane fatty acyl phospholipid synthase [Pseudomonas gingeri]NWB01255.1 cyclopropane fatty acyl phospholipid synthase [Pseudomonas gingeri]